MKKDPWFDWWLLSTTESIGHSLPMGILLALGSGLLASAAFHPIHFWPALIVGLVILYKLNRDGSVKERILLNLIFGISFQIVTLYWVGTYVGNFAWIALVLLQGTFFTILSFTSGALAFAAAWIAMEFVLRSFPFGGFGWSRLGFALTESPFNYLYPRLGIVGVAFLIVLMVGLAVDYKLSGVAIGVGALILFSLIPLNIKDFGKMDIALIQGGQSQKMDNTFENSESALSKHFTAMSTVKPNTVDLVIWPENAIMHDPYVRRNTRESLNAEINRINAPILVNANLSDGTNGSVLIGDGAIQSYSKRYLTPFGEFLPFQTLIEKLSDKAKKVNPYTPGNSPYLFKTEKGSFRTLICYELLSDKQARSEMSDTDFIVTQTNNATYFQTWQLEQELAIAQARSAETSRESAYVSTTGVTAIIDERGRITNSIPKYENMALIDTINLRSGITPATKYGSLLEIFILLIFILQIFFKFRDILRAVREPI